MSVPEPPENRAGGATRGGPARNGPPDPAPGLARLNDAGDRDAAGLLNEVCSCRSWVLAVAARPYPDVRALLAESDRATARMGDGDLAEALAGHSPIGGPKSGDPASAREQRGVRERDRGELTELNLAYRERFGHVFLIRASGRTGGEMLAALRRRLGNTPGREREVARGELGGINRLRLARLAEGAPGTGTGLGTGSGAGPGPESGPERGPCREETA